MNVTTCRCEEEGSKNKMECKEKECVYYDAELDECLAYIYNGLDGSPWPCEEEK